MGQIVVCVRYYSRNITAVVDHEINIDLVPTLEFPTIYAQVFSLSASGVLQSAVCEASANLRSGCLRVSLDCLQTVCEEQKSLIIGVCEPVCCLRDPEYLKFLMSPQIANLCIYVSNVPF